MWDRLWRVIEHDLIAVGDRRAVAVDSGLRDGRRPHLAGNRLGGMQRLKRFPPGDSDRTTAGEVDPSPHSAVARLLLESRQEMLGELRERGLDAFRSEPRNVVTLAYMRTSLG